MVTSSWYGDPFDGRQTASGEIFDKDALSAASPHLPFGTVLCVYNPANGKRTHIRVNDRGPYAEWQGVTYFEGRRDLDVSEAAAEVLGFKERGVVQLQIGSAK